MRPKPFVLLALLLTLALPLSARQAPEYGPAKGTLVIVGGGSTDGTGIIERFIEIAGGPDKKFVIVPTAGGNRNADGSVRPYQEKPGGSRVDPTGQLRRCDLIGGS